MIKFNDFKLKNEKTVKLSVKKGDFIFFSGDSGTELLESFYFNNQEFKDEIYFDSSAKLEFGKDIVYLNDEAPLQINRKILYSFKLPFYLYSTSNVIFKKRLYKLLSESSLLNRLSDRVFMLNNNEYRELIYFRMLINNPDVVVIDKFFMDTPRQLFLNSLKKLHQSGVTILMSGSLLIYNQLKSNFNMDLVEL